MVDSHCHLADEAFAADLESVIERARGAGVEQALVILEAGNEKEAAQAKKIASLWRDARFSIGVHPHQAHQFAGSPGTGIPGSPGIPGTTDGGDRVADLVRAQLEQTPAARAVGEVGLDYHYDFSPRDVQQAVFRAQVRLAREIDRPLVIHTREADDDTIRILREESDGHVRGVLHCFTGGPDLARASLDLGLFISLAGIITFPKAGDLRDTVRAVPLDRLLVETDSPFLAPVPYRGKRNEPAHVTQVAATVAQLHHVDAGELARQTTANFHTLFRP